jgi:hypothetical protein
MQRLQHAQRRAFLHAVVDCLCFAPGRHDVHSAQHRQVLRQRRCAQAGQRLQFRHRRFAFDQAAQHLQPGRWARLLSRAAACAACSAIAALSSGVGHG